MKYEVLKDCIFNGMKLKKGDIIKGKINNKYFKLIEEKKKETKKEKTGVKK